MKIEKISILFVGLVLASLILAGCTSSKTEKSPRYTCWDGSQVDDYHDCPPKTESQSYVCPDGSVVSDKDQCGTSNSGEAEIPKEETYVAPSGHPSKIGSLYAMENGQVIESYIILEDANGVTQVANGVIKINVTADETNRELYSKEITVRKENFYLATLGLGAFAHQDTIYSMPDIYTSNFEFMEDECSSVYCDARFSVTFETEDGKSLKASENLLLDSEFVSIKEIVCEGGDGNCPSKCNYLTDTDCPVHGLGEKVTLDNGIEITLSSNARIRHCYSESTYFEYDYGYFYDVPITIKNTGTGSEYIIRSDFILIDSQGTQYGVGYVGGDTCEGISELESSTMYPGSSASGSLWFDLDGKKSLPSGEKKILYDPEYGEGDEVVFLING